MDPYSTTERLRTEERLAPLVAWLDARFPAAFREGRGKELLSGRFVGHALHPPLTDVPVGLFVGSTLLDVIGRGRWNQASTVLTGAGLLAAVPTIASGVAEWDEVGSGDRRTAAVHAVSNAAATSCFLASFVAKRRGRTVVGAVAALIGAGCLGLGGYLGGHLAVGRGVGTGRRS